MGCLESSFADRFLLAVLEKCTCGGLEGCHRVDRKYKDLDKPQWAPIKPPPKKGPNSPQGELEGLQGLLSEPPWPLPATGASGSRKLNKKQPSLSWIFAFWRWGPRF